jgi:hypothetical protein
LGEAFQLLLIARRREDAARPKPSGGLSGLGLLAATGGESAAAGGCKAEQGIAVTYLENPADD